MKKSQFSTLLHECIGKGLKDVLGRKGANILLYDFNFSKSLNKPKEFHNNLFKIFGNVAIALELVIVKQLCRRLKTPYIAKEPFNYEKYINFLKKTSKPQESKFIHKK